MKKTGVSPTRAENYSEWYQQVIKVADLAEHSPVRGCMILKPYGYQISVSGYANDSAYRSGFCLCIEKLQ